MNARSLAVFVLFLNYSQITIAEVEDESFADDEDYQNAESLLELSYRELIDQSQGDFLLELATTCRGRAMDSPISGLGHRGPNGKFLLAVGITTFPLKQAARLSILNPNLVAFMAPIVAIFWTTALCFMKECWVSISGMDKFAPKERIQ